MRRREFIVMAGAACVLVSPLAARAQRAVPALVGFLAAGSKEGSFAIVDELKRGLTENGMLEGKDYILESYWAEGDYNRFASFARELVAKQPQVIVGNTIAAVQAAQRATTVIPIVMMGINDPVGTGIVNSLARPGGNTTGMATLNQDSATKLLQYLRGLLPNAADVVVILNPGNPSNLAMLRVLREQSGPIGVSLLSFEVSTSAMLDAAFAALLARKPDAILVIPDAATSSLGKPIAAKGLEHRIPIISASAALTAAGGLISYGLAPSDIPRRTAYFVRKVLDGVLPANLPVQQPTRLILSVNLRTARALGLAIPDTLLAIADTVIE
jgi:putative tryptophan/tyrosine transport system substrate-binding protein